MTILRLLFLTPFALAAVLFGIVEWVRRKDKH